ncbi:tetratricopeptide repeat protein [Stappia stellulata]|uniref:tetratricopeptide repeat protein n=1 Tax=Stappia stellulata TaxID=71235 RepID=UPI00041B32E8|nr:tetratricopeptide repeat protein [Stappia stellulata]
MKRYPPISSARRLFFAAGVSVAAAVMAPPPVVAKTDSPQIGTEFGLPMTLSGSYLSGRLAGQNNDLENAAAFFGEALEQDPGNPYLLDRTFVLKLANGDLAEALALAERLSSEQPDHFMAQLMLAVEALRAGKPDLTETLLADGGRGPLAVLTSGLVAAWALEERGETDAALARIASLEGPDWYTVFVAYHSALIQDHAGRNEAALENLKSAYEADRGALRVIDAYARALAKSGEPGKAIEILDQYDLILPDHPVLVETRGLIESGQDIGRIAETARAGAAEVLYGLGAALGRDGGEELAAVFLQLSLQLDIDADVAAIALAGLFDRQQKYERSITILKGIQPSSPLKRDAEIQIGINYNALDKLDESRAHLAALVDKDPGDLDAVTALGNVLRSHKLFAEADEIYSRGIDTISEPELKHWALFYYRGICRERLKNWGPAEADFRQSLALSPEQPLVLNYLGYSLVDRGLKLDEALDMIRKAVELRPRDGYIVDSLGWAYYKLGRYEEAVVELEKAVALRPEDPIINDHLGDAYWKVDRRLEARFQWNHARDLEPEPDELPKILDKIENGLSDDGSIPAATVGQELQENGG